MTQNQAALNPEKGMRGSGVQQGMGVSNDRKKSRDGTGKNRWMRRESRKFFELGLLKKGT